MSGRGQTTKMITISFCRTFDISDERSKEQTREATGRKHGIVRPNRKGSPAYNKNIGRGLRCLGSLLMMFSLSPLKAAKQIVWEPVPTEDLAATARKEGEETVEVEVLRSRIELWAWNQSITQENFRRIKVYSPKAIEAAEKIEFEYDDYYQKLEQLAARIVHVNGSIQELSEKDFQENNLEKTRYSKLKTKRLVAPNLKAGDIVEMCWRISEVGWFRGSRFFYCQERVPVREFEFRLHAQGFGMSLAWFHVPDAKLELKKINDHDGVLRIHNLPAYTAEPDMPPEFDARGSVMLVYDEAEGNDQKKWQEFSKSSYELQEGSWRVSGAVEAKARELAATAVTAEGKLKLFYDFCQQQVTNLNYSDTPDAVKERKSDRAFSDPRSVLKRGRGFGSEINALFAALAKAAKFEVRRASSGDRDVLLSIKISHGFLFANTNSVAVKVDGGWRFYSPGDAYVPCGMLRSQEEGADTLLADPKTIIWMRTPSAEPEASVRACRGELRLDEDGGLEGDITVERTGHFAARWKEQHWENNSKELTEAVRKETNEALANAEVTNIQVEHLRASGQSLTIHYHLHVPDFATVSGGRLIFVPNIFYSGSEPRYSQLTRKFPIVLPFAWKETDNYDIKLPEGYELDVADCPGPVNIGDGIFVQNTEIGYQKKNGRVAYSQEVSIGAGGRLIFEPKFYPGIKRAFEILNATSTHALILQHSATLKEKTTETAGNP
jgi:hypothetical protein